MVAGERRRRKRRCTRLARNTTALRRWLTYIRRVGDEFPRSTHDWPVMRQEFPTFSHGYRCSSCRTLPGHSSLRQNTFPLMLPAFSYRRLPVARSRQLHPCDLRRTDWSNGPKERELFKIGLTSGKMRTRLWEAKCRVE